MPPLGTDRFVSGIFKRELKNRFLCEVVINNQDNICYVPSSCHLSNFLSLENKKVILISIDGMRPDGLIKCKNSYVDELKK